MADVSNRPVVFIGPSLSISEAEGILDADYRRPLRAGDLDSIQPPAVVGVVDGVLRAGARLITAEAGRALERGVRLYGAASVGALLASELRDQGFYGLGNVFEFLKSYDGDKTDLVAALYAEHDNFLLTVPIIDVVLATSQISSRSAQDLSRLLCSIPLEDRTRDHIEFILGSPVGISQRTSAKSDDARTLLHHLKGLAAPNTSEA